MGEDIEKEILQDEMSFFDHIDVLRWHIMRSAIAILIFSIVAFIFHRQIFDTVLFGLLKEDFPTYKILCYLSDNFPGFEGMCIKGMNLTVINVDVAGQFSAAMSLSLLTGFIASFPYVFWEFWRFVKPGLHQNEIAKSAGIIFWTTLLFILGCLFGYFLMAPFSIGFLSEFSISEKVANNITLANYVGFINTSVVSCGIVFELPILSYFLTKIGLITPQFLRAHRKESILANLILSAVITPGDVSSQLIVALPIFILYEISILISAWVNKGNVKI